MGKLRDYRQFKADLKANKLTRREMSRVLLGVGIATMTIPTSSREAKASSSLEVFTWSDYKDERLHTNFITQYGSSPSFSVMSDNGEAFQKIRAGYAPDIAGPTSMFLNKWNQAGILKPLDTGRLENWNDVFSALKTLEGVTQNGHVMGYPFVWGNSSVLYRADLAPEYVENETWAIMWDPKYKGRISQRDAAHATAIQSAMLLGFEDPYSITESDLPAIRDKMAEQRELLRYYWSSQADVEQALASGELVAAYAWNSALTRLLKEGIKVKYMVPKEGILTWVDTHVLIAGGENSEEEQYDYLNAISTPEVGRILVEDFGYGTSNKKGFGLVKEETTALLGMTDPEMMLNNSVVFEALEPDFEEKISKLFEEVKAGI